MTTTPTKTEYVVSVPVYINMIVQRESGLSDEQVIKSLTMDDMLSAYDGEDLFDKLNDKVHRSHGPRVPIVVEDIGLDDEDSN